MGSANPLNDLLPIFGIEPQCDPGVYPARLSSQTQGFPPAEAHLYGGVDGYCIQFYNGEGGRAGATATNYLMRSVIESPTTGAGDAQSNLDQRCASDAATCVTKDGQSGIQEGKWPGKANSYYWTLRLDKVDTVTTEEWKTTGVKRDENCVTGDDPPESAKVRAGNVPLSAPPANPPGTEPQEANPLAVIAVIGVVVGIAGLYHAVCFHDYETHEVVSKTDLYRTTTLSRDDVVVPVAPVVIAEFNGGDFTGHDTWDAYEQQYYNAFHSYYDLGEHQVHLYANRATGIQFEYKSDLSHVRWVFVSCCSVAPSKFDRRVEYTMADNQESEGWSDIVVDWEAPEGLNAIPGASEPPAAAPTSDEYEYDFASGASARVLVTYDPSSVGPQSPGITGRILDTTLPEGAYQGGPQALSWEEIAGAGGSALRALEAALFNQEAMLKAGLGPGKSAPYESPLTITGTANPSATGDVAVDEDQHVADIFFDLVPQ